MDENLLALESEAIYQILAGNAGERPQLEGVTKERVAWEARGPAMTGIEAEMSALRDLAADLAPPAKGTTGAAPRELAVAEAELARLRARVARDPLGAEGGVDREIKPRLVALRARLDAERGARERVQKGIVEAHDLRRRLAEGHERARRLTGEAGREIVGPALLRLPPVIDESLLAGVDEWLGKIERTAAAHRWLPAEVGLGRWRATAEQYEPLIGFAS
jgi:hypothetical protein